MEPTAPADEMQQVLEGRHSDPFHVLGAHLTVSDGKPAVAVRAFIPEAAGVAVLADAGRREMTRVDPDGFFEALFEGRDQLFTYTLELTLPDGSRREIHDPYSFWPILSDYDIYLFGEGRHLESLRKTRRACPGVRGSVRRPFRRLGTQCQPGQRRRGLQLVERPPAPDALAADLRHLGTFHPRSWTGGNLQVRGRRGPGITWSRRPIPFAFSSELRPRTASVVCDIDRYAWGDEEWIARRRQANGLDRPISIYEVHPRLLEAACGRDAG